MEKTTSQQAIQSALQHALTEQEFLLYYQPKVDLNIGKTVGVEALLRWQRPGFGMLSPNEFIPLCEETGLIVPIGEWVLREACKQNKAWHQAGYSWLTAAVNLSSRQFRDDKLVGTIERILAETGLDPRFLELEITESLSLNQLETGLTTLSALKNMGIQLVIDDFGSAYSSFSYLRKLRIDCLKIDRAFVREIPKNSTDAAIVSAMIAMAHSLGIKVVAKGVETKEQLEFLSEHHCDEIQGYYFSPAVFAEEISQSLQNTAWLVS